MSSQGRAKKAAKRALSRWYREAPSTVQDTQKPRIIQTLSYTFRVVGNAVVRRYKMRHRVSFKSQVWLREKCVWGG